MPNPFCAVMLSISFIITVIDRQWKIRIIIRMADTTEVSPTISDLISTYLRSVERARSKHTMRAYKNGLQVFCETLRKKSLDPDTTPDMKSTRLNSSHVATSYAV